MKKNDLTPILRSDTRPSSPPLLFPLPSGSLRPPSSGRQQTRGLAPFRYPGNHTGLVRSRSGWLPCRTSRPPRGERCGRSRLSAPVTMAGPVRQAMRWSAFHQGDRSDTQAPVICSPKPFRHKGLVPWLIAHGPSRGRPTSPLHARGPNPARSTSRARPITGLPDQV
jgi:hypothetical protein